VPRLTYLGGRRSILQERQSPKIIEAVQVDLARGAKQAGGHYEARRLRTRGVKPLSDSLDEQRHKLLNLLFGSDVPEVLEGQLLRTADVAMLFEVSERTVSEWAKKGQIPSVRTPGGHRRYPAEGIKWLLEESRESGGDHPPRSSPLPAEKPAKPAKSAKSGN